MKQKKKPSKLLGIHRKIALIYLAFFFLSIVFIVSYFFLNGKVTEKMQTVLISLGTCFLSASMLAYVIDLSNARGKAAFRRSIRTKSMSSLYFALKTMFDRFIWLTRNFENDEFEWNLSPDEYGSKEFAERWSNLSAVEVFGTDAENAFNAAISRLIDFSESSDVNVLRVESLFSIISVSLKEIDIVTDTLNNSQLFFESNKIITRSELREYTNAIDNMIKDMEKADPSKKTTDIRELFRIYKKLCEGENFVFSLSPDNFDFDQPDYM